MLMTRAFFLYVFHTMAYNIIGQIIPPISSDANLSPNQFSDRKVNHFNDVI